MQYLALLIIAALVFAICFGLDKAFVKLFRNKTQHQSGMALRANKRYGSIGLVVAFFGIAGLLSGLGGQKLMLVAGTVLVVTGMSLIIYYLFYDEDTLLYSAFGRKSRVYRFEDIQGQKLYRLQGGNILVELYMADGTTLHVQPGTMDGAEAFLNYAYAGWQRQKKLSTGDCSFYDASNSIWFPTMEDT